MNLSLYIAKRYLFSKKSHNAIHIISLVAVCGVAIATMATVCTLSVFNGFGGLVSDMFSLFDPELKITPAQGKIFDPLAAPFLEIRSFPEIEQISESVEDNVLVKYRERQLPAVMKGVSGNFDRLVPVQDILFDGEFKLREEDQNFAVVGIGVAGVLGANAQSIFPLDIYAPKRNVRQVNLANPLTSFNVEYTRISGVFMVGQPVYDDNYLLVPIEFARALFDYSTEVSAWEIKLKPGTAIRPVQRKIQQVLGAAFEVKDRYEQQEAAFKMINIEKWVTFLMLCFILLIAAFNVIGSLSMLIVDKQNDIATLRNLGAGNQLISRIFLLEGWLISSLGAVAGIVLGVLLCLGQQYFGWIRLGSAGTFAVDAYPVHIEILDLILILLAVLLVGFLAVLYPVRYLSRKQL
jgi:lipoprotein-releasing system permease protein/zinc transport system substrate-binding protein